MKFYNLVFAFFLCVVWGGCNVINPPEKTPTYVHIDSFKFNNTKPGITGSASHNINTAWVNYNGITIGVFDLPATVPIIAAGSGLLTILPGITQNGMNNFQAVYPFYSYDTSTLVAQPGKMVNRLPQTSYIDEGIRFPFREDFELGNSFIKVDDNSGAAMTRTTDTGLVFEGNGSGLVTLKKDTTSDSFAQIIFVQDLIAIPQGYSYCEFNYKGNLNIAVGLLEVIGGVIIGNPPGPQYFYGFSPTSSWQKIYVKLGDFIQTNPGSYKLAFYITLPPGQTSGYLLMDNVKIVDTGN